MSDSVLWLNHVDHYDVIEEVNEQGLEVEYIPGCVYGKKYVLLFRGELIICIATKTKDGMTFVPTCSNLIEVPYVDDEDDDDGIRANNDYFKKGIPCSDDGINGIWTLLINSPIAYHPPVVKKGKKK